MMMMLPVLATRRLLLCHFGAASTLPSGSRLVCDAWPHVLSVWRRFRAALLPAPSPVPRFLARSSPLEELHLL